MKFACCTSGDTDVFAVTLNVPETLLKAKAGAVASPLAFVVVRYVSEPLNKPDAPLAGAVKVIPTPGAGFPKLSTSKATKLELRLVPITPCCPAPELTLILSGAAGALIKRMLVVIDPAVTSTLY